MRRCACRPGCLSWLFPDDELTATPAGDALRVHVVVDAYPAEQLALDDIDVAS